MKPELKDALTKILNACHKAGKKCGVYCAGGEQAKAFADQGFDMMNIITDYVALKFAAMQELAFATGQEAPSRGAAY